MAADLGWKVQRYDPDYDERRGRWEDTGHYWHDQAKAQAYADSRNAQLLEDFNVRCRQQYEVGIQRYRESVALVAAGLRDKPVPDPGEFVPLTELRSHDMQYTVEPIEPYEYEDEA